MFADRPNLPCSWLALVVAVTLLVMPADVFAQENGQNFEGLYNDALKQLADAQQRKNELAKEIEKLKARIAAQDEELKSLRDGDAALRERSMFLRVHYEAWQRFVEASPDVAAAWTKYLDEKANAFTAPDGRRLTLVPIDPPAEPPEKDAQEPPAEKPAPVEAAPATEPADAEQPAPTTTTTPSTAPAADPPPASQPASSDPPA